MIRFSVKLLRGAVMAMILADLETIDKRSRRFTRYFSIAHLYNAGLSEDELQTYRNALAKLLNSLSWHPRITLPQAVPLRQTALYTGPQGAQAEEHQPQAEHAIDSK